MKEVLRLDHGVLTHFPASAGRNKPALILCPGGGYEYCSIREGAPVACAFARDGVEAFVLEYDCTEVPLGVKPLHSSASRQTALRSADFRRAPIWQDCWRRRGTTQTGFPRARICRRTDRMRRCCAIRWSRRECMRIAAALCVWQAKMLRNSRGFRSKRWFLRTCRARFCGTP